MAGRGRKPAVPRKKANGYKMPGPIPSGEVINDTIGKKKWRIGSPIAVGGFGEIYSACDHENASKGGNYPFVVKIEPHENGPLFVEKHFYIRNANKDDIAKFAKSKKLSTFGMPTYFGNGSHECNGVKYRYLVLERYGKDLWSLFLDNGRKFPTTTVFQIGLQMLDVLEYIHCRGYVHADIKGANILLGLKKGTENQAYLMDFGLATRVNEKEFKPDPKCAHNGTIEYTSRDAHLGVATMRGDLEILGYNMLQWIVGELPWEKCLAKPKTVQDMKEAFMKGVRNNISKQYTNVPDSLIKFFEYINTLKPKDLPDYTKCRQFFESYLKSEGKLRNSKLDFTPSKKGKKNKVVDQDDDDAAETYNGDAEKPVRKPKAVKKVTKLNGEFAKSKRGRKPKEETPVKDDSSEEESETTPKERKVRKYKVKSPVKIDESGDSDSNRDSLITKNTKENGDVAKPKRGRKPIAKSPIEVDDSEDTDFNPDSGSKYQKQKDVAKPVRGKKLKIDTSSSMEDDENEEPDPDYSLEIVPRRPNRVGKRKSMEPSVVVNVKKTKMAPKATPPAKKNHTNIGTQTSTERPKRSPRQVSFNSPISQLISDKKPLRSSTQSANSSGDIFEDSFVIEEKKVKPKKKLLSDEVVTVKVEKKVTVKSKGKSWKNCPTVK